MGARGKAKQVFPPGGHGVAGLVGRGGVLVGGEVEGVATAVEPGDVFEGD